VRSKVEHVFGVLKVKFGFVKVRYRGLAKNANRFFAVFSLGEPVPNAQEAVAFGGIVSPDATAKLRQGTAGGKSAPATEMPFGTYSFSITEQFLFGGSLEAP
jgi:hypothetical protein